MNRYPTVALILLACLAPARAQDTPPAVAIAAVEAPPAPEPPWSGSAELSYVATSGNTDSTSLGLGGTLEGKFGVWEQAYRARFTRIESDGEESANSLEAAGRLGRALSETVSLFVEAGYLRNRYAGMENRYSTATGVSWKALTGPVHALELSGGVGYVHEDRLDVGNESFAVAVASSSYRFTISERSHFDNQTNLELSLEDGDDWRARNIAALVADLNDVLALKLAVDMNYFNNPVPGFEELDTITSAAIVASF